MAYILAVNPAVFSALPGMPSGSVFTATALASIIGTQVMAKLEAARGGTDVTSACRGSG
jgi:AGZA family xanthine/uracil permease-like MFS transporter